MRLWRKAMKVDSTRTPRWVISQSEWRRKPKDYKSVANGVRHVLKLMAGGTTLVPVTVVSDKEYAAMPQEEV
jgi:hypothetical protein